MRDRLKYALHYNEIVSFEYDENDFITKRIINYYRSYLFEEPNCNNYHIKNLDKVVYEYFINYKFNKYAKDYLEELELSYDNIDYYNNLDINLPKLYKKYKESLDLVSTTRWL